MKLINVLVKELPSKGGWHPEAAFYAQDKSGRITAYSKEPRKDGDAYSYNNMIYAGWGSNADFFGKKSSDWDSTVISKSEYDTYIRFLNFLLLSNELFV